MLPLSRFYSGPHRIKQNTERKNIMQNEINALYPALYHQVMPFVENIAASWNEALPLEEEILDLAVANIINWGGLQATDTAMADFPGPEAAEAMARPGFSRHQRSPFLHDFVRTLLLQKLLAKHPHHGFYPHPHGRYGY